MKGAERKGLTDAVCFTYARPTPTSCPNSMDTRSTAAIRVIPSVGTSHLMDFETMRHKT